MSNEENNLGKSSKEIDDMVSIQNTQETIKMIN